jgi:hypothetical protein
MSKGGNSQIPETETRASRVLFISSGDATAIFNDNRSNYKFTLQEAVVVPNHHSILMSLIGAEIPYSFYNFADSRNTLLYYQYNPVTGSTVYAAGIVAPVVVLQLRPEGNWNAVELAEYITRGINIQLVLAPNSFQMLYDPIALKFKFIMNTPGRITLAMKNSPNLVVDMNEEIGFDLTNTPGDPFVENVGGAFPIRYGYVNEPIGGTGIGTNTYLDGGGHAATPISPLIYLYADDVCDMSNSIRTLFIRSNLTSSSILDSHVGGGFSNILARIPIDKEPGEIINIRASDGNVHQLLLKIKEFTEIHIRLTNQRNEEINLNGLDFNISLKLDFIENKRLQMPDNIRQLVDEGRKEISDIEKVDKDLSKTKKKKTKPKVK